MVRSRTPEPAGSDQSLGDLVALAAKDVSALVRYEINLAKTELRGDLRRVGLAAALAGVAAFVGILVLVLCCIALAYGLVTLGIWTWAAFLIVAGLCILLAAGAVGIAIVKVRHLSGLKKTRQSVTEGIGMLRRDGQHDTGQTGDGQISNGQHRESLGHDEQGSKSLDGSRGDGQRPETAGRESR
jgi:multisubunit Na+/H+ antiporter MnhG subunit